MYACESAFLSGYFVINLMNMNCCSIAGPMGGMPVVNGSAPAQQAISLPVGAPGMVPASTLPTAIMPAPGAEPVGIPSECLLLKNMFDPATEVRFFILCCSILLSDVAFPNSGICFYKQTEPDFDEDIKEDVAEECSKFGRVKHIHVDK